MNQPVLNHNPIHQSPTVVNLEQKKMEEIVKKVTVKYLSKRNAKAVQELVQGLVLVQSEEVDVSKIHSRDLIQQAKESGKVTFAI